MPGFAHTSVCGHEQQGLLRINGALRRNLRGPFGHCFDIKREAPGFQDLSSQPRRPLRLFARNALSRPDRGRRRRGKARLGGEPSDGRCLGITHFEKGGAVGGQQSGGSRQQPAVRGQPLRLRQERPARFPDADLRRQGRPFRGGDIGRIGEDDVEPAGDGLGPVAADEGRPRTEAEPIGVGAGDLQGVGADVDANAGRGGERVQESEKKAAAAGAEIEDATGPPAATADEAEGRLDEGLESGRGMRVLRSTVKGRLQNSFSPKI